MKWGRVVLVAGIHVRIVIQKDLCNHNMSRDCRRMQRSTLATTTFVGILLTCVDEIFNDAMNTAKSGIIKGRWLWLVGRFAEPSTGRNVVDVVHQNPCCKMISAVKETVHPALYVRRHVLVLSMIEPVLCRIFGKREVVGAAFSVIIQFK